MTDPVRAASIRTLFDQMRTHASAAAVITLYMVGTGWPFTDHRQILIWTAAAVLVQAARLLLRRAFDRRNPGDADLPRWARAYAVVTACVGLLWAASAFLFIHPERPITVALTLCCLYSIASGSTPSHAYYPPSLYAMIAPIFVAVLIELTRTGQWGYILLGIASALYALTMVGFCRNQRRTIEEGFRIRFENAALLQSLQEQTVRAEDARRQAEQASLAKSQFLAAASHDLRQPLYALSLFSYSLRDLALDEDGRQVVGRILDSVAAMETLFEGLLDISKLEAGVVQARLIPVDVDALFDRLSQVFRPIALGKGLDFRLRSNGEWVVSDAVLLEQVLSNLVANAIRSTARGGVLLAARASGQGVRLEVWDTGIGIAEADQERIFDEFVQVGNAERDRRKGLGLGLAIARRSAALIDATIDLASRPAVGSRFGIAQPAVVKPAAPSPSRQPEAASASIRHAGLPLLIIDDEHDVSAALSGLLHRWGIEADVVSGGAEAIAAVARGRRYGMILSDYRLADGDGLTLIETLRAIHTAPPPPAVLITGDVDPALAAAAEAQHVPIFLKPVHFEALQALIGIEARTPSAASKSS